MHIIKYIPIINHPLLRVVGAALLVISLLPLLFSINHLPNYGGVLPIEFLLAPCIYIFALCVHCEIVPLPAYRFRIQWRFLGFKFKAETAENVILVQHGKFHQLTATVDGRPKEFNIISISNSRFSSSMELWVSLNSKPEQA